MIVDAHAHLASWPNERTCINYLKRSMKKYHIAYSLLSDCDCSEFRDGENSRNKEALSAVEGAKRVLKLVKKDPTHFGCAVWINPHFEKVSDELISFIENNRKYIFALKFHPYESRLKISDKRLLPYLDLARRFSLPILVHTASDKYSDIKMLCKLAIKNPDIVFVAAHLQLLSDNLEAIECLKKAPNLYADTAWVPLKNAKKTLLEVGNDRIMFGTDNPVDGLDTLNNPMYQQYYRNSLRLKKELHKKLMADNAIALYKLPISND